MRGFPLGGPNKRIAEFLRQMSTAYDILSIVYGMSKAEQEELMLWLDQKHAQQIIREREQNDG